MAHESSEKSIKLLSIHVVDVTFMHAMPKKIFPFTDEWVFLLQQNGILILNGTIVKASAAQQLIELYEMSSMNQCADKRLDTKQKMMTKFSIIPFIWIDHTLSSIWQSKVFFKLYFITDLSEQHLHREPPIHFRKCTSMWAIRKRIEYIHYVDK